MTSDSASSAPKSTRSTRRCRLAPTSLQNTAKTHTTAMSTEPSMMFKIGRPDGSEIPLIPVDELPAGIRVLAKLNTSRPASSSIVGTRGKDTSNFDIQFNVSDMSEEKAVTLFESLLDRFSEEQVNSMVKAHFPSSPTDIKSDCSSFTSSAPSQDFKWLEQAVEGPKTHCTHWLHSGQCEFVQSGCKYKHEMPDTEEGRAKVGLRGIPEWFLNSQHDKFGRPLEALDRSGERKGQAKDSKSWLKDREVRMSVEDIQLRISSLLSLAPRTFTSDLTPNKSTLPRGAPPTTALSKRPPVVGPRSKASKVRREPSRLRSTTKGNSPMADYLKEKGKEGGRVELNRKGPSEDYICVPVPRADADVSRLSQGPGEPFVMPPRPEGRGARPYHTLKIPKPVAQETEAAVKPGTE